MSPHMKLFTGKDFSRQCKRVGREGENMSSGRSSSSRPNSGGFFAFDSTSLGSGSGCSDAVTASIKYSTGIDCGRGRATDSPPPATRSTCTPMASLRPPRALLWILMAPFWTLMTPLWTPLVLAPLSKPVLPGGSHNSSDVLLNLSLPRPASQIPKPC